ncbi:MAG: DUF502 domain-containing protein [Gammaproteobacteria bacterium]|jgi:uncharacterized membrane protein|nr:hypothetical protein [Gammaproteobacteria bacterium]MBQ09068.1 hypothetical protein [Gammaproteobacteria bacterium]MDP6146830.1 DUF502 domain-containing protein [Gammaproteobacteria bacterium]HJL80891.1 DUF502 domain-containing protein [Gammaproteobacteria bacterium]HJM08588.1 DUF502 domain-containing protein [Gammaproteobacteria bacterium]|tara:strand:- start:11491 stop:12111 length:621 start_codon:yes stop_codon:yes gene_type:complete
MKKLRTIIVAGLLVWIPLGLTIFVIKLLIDLLGQTYLLVPSALRPENLLGIEIPGIGVVTAIVLVLLTGLTAVNYFGNKIIKSWDAFLDRIPLIRSIYSPLKKFSELVLSDQTQSFSKVLLIEYPRKGVYSLCFQTSKELGEVQNHTGEELVCVYIPTTPNPTSGYIVLVPQNEVKELKMGVEDALKMIISLGVVVPDPDALIDKE